MDYATTLRDIERKLQQSKQIASFYRGLTVILGTLFFTTLVGIMMFYLGVQYAHTL